MILNTLISIAFKNMDDEYDIKEISLFEIDKISKSIPDLDIKINKNREVNIKLKCRLCDAWHYYEYNLNELLKRDMTILGCETYGRPLVIIGNTNKVKEFVCNYKEVNRKIYAMI